MTHRYRFTEPPGLEFGKTTGREADRCRQLIGAADGHAPKAARVANDTSLGFSAPYFGGAGLARFIGR